MKCSSCGMNVPASADACPYCGKRMKQRTPFLGKLVAIIVAVALLFLVLANGQLFKSAGGTLLPLCVIVVASLLLMGGKKK